MDRGAWWAVQQVFDTAIYLMDEQSETSGNTLITDTNEYKFRTLSICNAVLPSLYPYSDTCSRSGAGRPVCPPLTLPDNPANPDFTQSIPLDDTLGRYPCPGRTALCPGGPFAFRGE